MNAPRFDSNWQSITGVVTILGFILALFVADSQEGVELPDLLKYILAGFASIYILSTIFANRVSRYLYNIKLWFNRQTGSTIIIDKRFFRISLNEDTGSHVNIYEETYFKKLRRKSSYTSEIIVDGSIDPSSIRTLNCSYTTNDEGNVRIYFLSSALAIKDNSQDKSSFYSYSMDAVDSFSGTKESWLFPIRNLMRKFEIHVVFPKSRIPKKANVYASKQIYKIEELGLIEDKDIVFERVDEAPFMASPYCRKAVVKLFNLRIGRIYKFEWEW